MGNSKSKEMAFLIEPMDPFPIVSRNFCFERILSLIIPVPMARTNHDCFVQMPTGEVVFLWKGSQLTLMNAERTIFMQMERKVHENINTHNITVTGVPCCTSGWLADITVNFPFPSVFEPHIQCIVEINHRRVSFSVKGDWEARSAYIIMHIGEKSITAARIRSIRQGRPFDEYILDVIPGVDVAFMVLICTAIDTIANLTRGVIF